MAVSRVSMNTTWLICIEERFSCDTCRKPKPRLCWPNATTSTSSTSSAEWYARAEGSMPFSGGELYCTRRHTPGCEVESSAYISSVGNCSTLRVEWLSAL